MISLLALLLDVEPTCIDVLDIHSWLCYASSRSTSDILGSRSEQKNFPFVSSSHYQYDELESQSIPTLGIYHYVLHDFEVAVLSRQLSMWGGRL